MDKVGKNRGWDRVWEDGGRGKSGADVLHLLGKVFDKVISSEGGREGRGRGEEEREHGKLFPGDRGVDFGLGEGRFGCSQVKSEKR